MAEADPNPQPPKKPADEQKLKYLGFVVILVRCLFNLIAKVYSFLKANSGPLKPGINTVENGVRSFAGPVCGKFDNVPIECLKFVDRKIDKSVKQVKRRVKHISRRAFTNAKKDPNPQPPKKPADEQKLKYLGFVVILVRRLFLLIVKLYSLLKANSGPLKPGMNTVENAVRSFAGPVCGKFDNVPIECLKFVDRKIDKSMKQVQRRVSKALKRVSRRAFRNAKKAPVAARSVMCDVKNTGMVETALEFAKTVYAKYKPVAKDIYTKYEPVTEQYASSAWHFLNQYTLIHLAVRNLGPIANHYSKMYNEKVQDAAEKGYKVASRLPLVPIEKIAKVLSDGNVEPVADLTHEKGIATQ